MSFGPSLTAVCVCVCALRVGTWPTCSWTLDFLHCPHHPHPPCEESTSLGNSPHNQLQNNPKSRPNPLGSWALRQHWWGHWGALLWRRDRWRPRMSCGRPHGRCAQRHLLRRRRGGLGRRLGTRGGHVWCGRRVRGKSCCRDRHRHGRGARARGGGRAARGRRGHSRPGARRLACSAGRARGPACDARRLHQCRCCFPDLAHLPAWCTPKHGKRGHDRLWGQHSVVQQDTALQQDAAVPNDAVAADADAGPDLCCLHH